MSCSFLVKFEHSREYNYFIIQGCAGASTQQAATRWWLDQVKEKGIELRLHTFAEQIDEHSVPLRVYVKSIQGVSIVEELFELCLERVEQEIENGVKVPVTALVAKPLQTFHELVPFLK